MNKSKELKGLLVIWCLGAGQSDEQYARALAHAICGYDWYRSERSWTPVSMKAAIRLADLRSFDDELDKAHRSGVANRAFMKRYKARRKETLEVQLPRVLQELKAQGLLLETEKGFIPTDLLVDRIRERGRCGLVLG